jgi:thiopurine S-methyltransferase
MKNDFWHTKWKSNEIGFNQKNPNPLMQRYFKTLDLKVGCRVLVPLCGKSIDMIWLMKQGYQVIGVELNESACKAFLKENKISAKVTKLGGFIIYSNDQITLFVGDFFQLNTQMLGGIDAVYDRAALVALPTELRKRYADHLSDLLSEQAKVLLIATSYNQCEMEGPPFSVNENEVSALFEPKFKTKQLYSKNFSEIPSHLRTKGLLQAKEEVYCLTCLAKHSRR